MSDMERYRTLFLDESRRHLETAEGILVAGVGGAGSEVDALFREIHSLKGMAASMGYAAMAELAHRLEDHLDRWRAGAVSPTPDGIDLCLKACDRLRAMREDVEQGGVGDAPWDDLASRLSDAPGHDAAGSAPTLRVRVTIDPACESPAARAYLVLLRFRELDPRLSSEPAEAEILRGRPVASLDLSLQGVGRESVTALFESLTEVASLAFLDDGPTPSRLAAAAVARPEPSAEDRGEEESRLRLPDTVQAPIRLLDEFVDLVGELTITRSHLDDTARTLGSEILREEVDRLGGLIRTFHSRVMGLRMLPFSIVTGGLKRVARDVAGRLGKDVELRVSGEEIGMDKSILLHLSDPLVHLLRNALDHGLELPEERRRKGKPAAGTIEIRAGRAKNQIEVTVSDDGRGIDGEAVRRKAVEAGLFGDEESRRLGTREILACLFRPGFSTRAEVSELSGRGVGLDVVKTQVDALGGSIELVSVPGAGTEVTLTLPLSVAIVPVLTVAVGSSVLALPVTSVASTIEALARDVREKDGAHVLLTEQGQVPIVSLARLLRLKGQRRFERMPLVLVQGGAGLSALAVDRFLREEDLFIKPLKGPLRRLPGLSGYSVLGDGGLVFLLDPASLLHS
ncbi:MAG: chemotaxis protein CheA [Deltaproteobacteria bacterium]|nr:chemotaxis protein CheA [Deltaproteobacteria bacterium]